MALGSQELRDRWPELFGAGAAVPTGTLSTTNPFASPAPIERTELPEPAPEAQPPAQPGDGGVTAGQIFESILGAIPLLGTGVAIYERFKRQNDAKAQAAATALERSKALQELTDGFARAQGDPQAEHNVIVSVLRRWAADDKNMLNDPEAPAYLLAAGQAMKSPDRVAAVPTTREFREGQEQVTRQFDPASGQWIEQARGPAFAPPAGPAVVMQPGDTRAQQLMAERAFKEIPADLRDVRGRQSTVNSMLGLLEAGTETGQWPDAVKTAIRDKLGVDVGVDPRLDTLRSLANSQTLQGLTSLKGSYSDRDVQFVQAIGATPTRSRAANIAVLKAQRAVMDRQERELQAEQAYYDKNGSLAGFDAWLQHESQSWGPVITSELQAEINSAVVQGHADNSKSVDDLVRAVEEGARDAVDTIIGGMTDDQLRALPQSIRSRAMAILDGDNGQ